MPWLQVRLAISPEQAETYEDAFLEVGAVSVTFMDAEDQPIFEPELNTTPLWAHTHLLALFEGGTEPAPVLAHLELLTGSPLPSITAKSSKSRIGNVAGWTVSSQCVSVSACGSCRAGMPRPSLMRSTCCWTRPGIRHRHSPDYRPVPGMARRSGPERLQRAGLRLRLGDSGDRRPAARRQEAVGTDIDVQALEASRDNAGRNNIADELFPLYLPEDLPQVKADVLVANILAGPLVSLALQLSGLVKSGGRLALSGILAEQGEEVAAAYAQDFDLDPIANRDGWVRITGRRR